MYLEDITNIDAGDSIAFIDDLQFEYEGVHEITADQEQLIDWILVNSAQFSGSIVHLQVTHEATYWDTEYNVPADTKVIVFEEN